MRSLLIRLLIWSLVNCAAFCYYFHAYDRGLSKELQNAITEDEFALAVRDIFPRRHGRNDLLLLSIEFTGAKHKFSLILERNVHRVTISTTEKGRIRTQHVSLKAMQSRATSLLLDFSQKSPTGKVELYADCVYQGIVVLPFTLQQMLMDVAPHNRIRVERDRRLNFSIYTAMQTRQVMEMMNCPAQNEHEYEFLSSKSAEQFVSDSASFRMADYFQEHRAPEYYINNQDHATFVRALTELTSAMKQMHQDLQIQYRETRLLREVLQNCAACKGMHCNGGCAACVVRPNKTCDDKPCAPGVQCIPLQGPPHFRCGSCPDGFEGDGVTCKDINECAIARPCDPRVECVNLEPGFYCKACPPGFTGEIVRGAGLKYAQQYRQVCTDINECLDGNNGGCVENSICQNLEGSFRCGGCREGFIGNQSVGCVPSNRVLCPDGTLCHEGAECVPIFGSRRYYCKCKIGWVGDGKVCGLDRDLDGWPDKDLPCELENCRKDNCPFTANSGQEDADKDGIGDLCDDDSDNDFIPDNNDNCALVYNPNQEDSDDDLIGDACDNCPHVTNTNQSNADRDEFGDVCDPDADNDGIINRRDNCPYIPNRDQADRDGDGVGDVCDNCPDVRNPSQRDSDKDLVGDACDTGVDRDKDGIQDNRDNCPDFANSDQLDTDQDGFGDVCDPDIDGDGIVNGIDNCPLRANPDQLDLNNNSVGDLCELDWDGDRVPNHLDVCPNNSLIDRTDFRSYQTVALDPEGDSQIDPNWVIFHEGAEIMQTMNSDPGLAVGLNYFGGVDFEGTFYVDTETDNDYVGFVFSYQDNRKYYVVMWKKYAQTYWDPYPFRAYAETGIQLKKVHSKTGPGKIMRNGLWHTGNTTDEVTLLWKDPNDVGWKERMGYRWLLMHRPKIGLMRLRIYKEDTLLSDSGNVFDATYLGGRLGVFVFSQEMIIWSALVYRCNEAVSPTIYYELPPHLRSQVEIDRTPPPVYSYQNKK